MGKKNNKKDKKVRSIIREGCKVWYQAQPNGKIETDWYVVSQHLTNQHGHDLDMLIENKKGQRLRHFMGSHWPATDTSPGVLIFAKGIPKGAPPYRKSVKLIIDKYNGDYGFFCTNCNAHLVIEQRTEEQSDLRLHEDGSVTQGKPIISDGSGGVRCDCTSIDRWHKIEFDTY